MGRLELQALTAKRTGLVLDPCSHAEIKPSGPKEKKPLRAKSLKRQAEERSTKKAGGDPHDMEVEEFFDKVAKEEAGDCHCWECNGFVPDKFIRHATAHIFPKDAFRSIAAHPKNYLILAASCCHNNSHRMDLFSKMNIFREAVDRFFEFEPCLTPEDRKKKWYWLFVRAANASFPDLFQTRPDLWLL